MRFEKRTAIITGAGAGIGKSAALGFAREGAAVFITDINESTLEETAREIRSAGGKAVAAAGDVTKSETVKRVVGKALEQTGKVDILFNYVGGMPPIPFNRSFLDNGEEVWDAFIELNLKSTLRFTRAVLGSMIENRYGKIISTGSGAAREGVAGMVLYSAAKGGVISFTKSLAKEVAQYSINVNCVCPGPTATPTMLKGFEKNPESRKAYENGLPLKRLGKPEEVASTVIYLASDDASFITGQTISVDGGEVMY